VIRRPDPIAVFFGAVFVAFGVLAIAGRVDLLSDSQWIWPGVLVAVGIIMLAAVAGGARRRTLAAYPPPPPPPATAPADPPPPPAQ
jgi:hypothetical protein